MDQAAAKLESVPLLQRRIGSRLEMDRGVNRFRLPLETMRFTPYLSKQFQSMGAAPLKDFGADSSRNGITLELLSSGRPKREER